MTNRRRTVQTERDEQQRPTPQCNFASCGVLTDPQEDLSQSPRILGAKGLDKVSLVRERSGYTCVVVADEQQPRLILLQVVNRTHQRVQPAGEQTDRARGANRDCCRSALSPPNGS